MTSGGTFRLNGLYQIVTCELKTSHDDILAHILNVLFLIKYLCFTLDVAT